jgi:hypothetical protein
MASHIAKKSGIETRTWVAPSTTPTATAAAPSSSIPSSVLAPPPSKSTPAKAPVATGTKPVVPPAVPAPTPVVAAPKKAMSPPPTDDAFGATQQMSTEFRQWCVENAKKLSADMSLLEFCFTLEDVSEIKDTIQGYLGSKQPVQTFAEEFIRRMQLDKNPSGGKSSSGSASLGAGGAGGGGKKKNRG